MNKLNLTNLLKNKIEQNKNREIEIPIFCPWCSTKLKHVNAIDTEAKIYFVYCPQPKCRYCKEWRLIDGKIKEM
jgi:hypothetical protein